MARKRRVKRAKPGTGPRAKYKHERIESPEKFDPRSFRVVEIKPGVKATIGCPKGKWNSSRKRCKVGTRIQKLMKRKRGRRGR